MSTYKRDIISSLTFGVGAVALYLYVAQFPVRASQPVAVSSGFYPKILALVLGVLALIQLVSAVVKEAKSGRPGAAVHDTAAPRLWKDASAFRLFLLTLAALIVYPFLMQVIGFSITGLLFLGTLIFALSRDNRRGREVWIILAVTLGIGLLTFVVFRYFLNIPFPRGILFPR